MAYIKNKHIKIGDIVKLNKDYISCAGTFEKGTIVRITGCNERGFDIMDEFGNKMTEMGFDIGEKLVLKFGEKF